MSREKVSVDELADAIKEELESYQQEATDSLKASIRATAKTCAQEISQASPVSTGSYSKGWGVKVVRESRFDLRAVVCNRTDHQLTHLLEYGHAGRGGTGAGAAPAYPHIRPAEERAIKAVGKSVKAVFGGG